MIASAIGGAAALASAIYGAAKSAEYNDKARSLIQRQRDDNRRWYDTKMAQDYTQRADAQAVINRQREMLEENQRRARATNAVAGGTDASLALQQEKANDAMAQTMSDLAADSAKYRDTVEQQYRTQDAALNQQQAQNLAQQGQATAQAAGQAVNAGVGLIGADITSKKKEA